MSTVTASTVACNGKALIVGTAEGLVMSLVPQRKPQPSTKAEVQPSYIATQHARKVTCIAASANAFATGSDDCTIVVSRIGCLFTGGDANVHSGKVHYRITGAHALPITALAFVPSDETLLVSASKDGTVVSHRLHFAANTSAAAGSALPCVPLAQSMDRLVRLPFAVLTVTPVMPSDGTLFAAAGIDTDDTIRVAIIDFGVAQRDGNGTGRPLTPFTLLPTADIAKSAGSSLKLACVEGKLVLIIAEAKAVQYDLAETLKSLAIGRPDDELKSETVEVDDVKKAIEGSSAQFIGTSEQVTNAVTLVTSPKAKVNPYYASIYANYCWSTWARPASCTAVADPKASRKVAASDSEEDEDANNASSPGYGKRARKTRARQARAEADAADWARLSLAVDHVADEEAIPTHGLRGIPLRYTQLLSGRSLTSAETPFAYEPLATSETFSVAAVSAADEEETFVTAALNSQKAKNAAIQARIDALYASVTAAAASRKTGRDEEASASPKGRGVKKHIGEKAASPKSVFSLT